MSSRTDKDLSSGQALVEQFNSMFVKGDPGFYHLCCLIQRMAIEDSHDELIAAIESRRGDYDLPSYASVAREAIASLERKKREAEAKKAPITPSAEFQQVMTADPGITVDVDGEREHVRSDEDWAGGGSWLEGDGRFSRYR